MPDYQQDAEKLRFSVTPAKAGVQEVLKRLDSCFRRNDNLRSKGAFSATCLCPNSLNFVKTFCKF